MSSTVKSYGFLAVLDDPLEGEERDNLSEELYDNKSGLQINYEGTLVYLDFNLHAGSDVREDIYGLTIGNRTEAGEAKFHEALSKAGLCVTVNTVQPFEEIWYNGGDSVLDMLTLEEYLDIINKEVK